MAVAVAANTTKLPPETAAAPFDVTNMMAMVPSCTDLQIDSVNRDSPLTGGLMLRMPTN